MPKISAPTLVMHREVRRQELIAAALELAMEEGATGVTVSAVAKKAGLARTSIYEYFASSADLIADLILEELDYYALRLAEAIDQSAEPYEQIAQWIAEGLRYVADGRHMLVKSLNTVSTPDSRKSDIALGHRKMMAPLQIALIATGIKNIQGAASYLQSITDAASIRIDAGHDATQEIEQATKFAVAGLRALALEVQR